MVNSIVYLYGFSPSFNQKLESLLDILGEQIKSEKEISVVLIHDGVIGISQKGITPKSLNLLLGLNINVYAMIPDIEARGIDPNNILHQINTITYEDLVDILASTEKIVSWM